MGSAEVLQCCRTEDAQTQTAQKYAVTSIDPQIGFDLLIGFSWYSQLGDHDKDNNDDEILTTPDIFQTHFIVKFKERLFLC